VYVFLVGQKPRKENPEMQQENFEAGTRYLGAAVKEAEAKLRAAIDLGKPESVILAAAQVTREAEETLSNFRKTFDPASN
jgi:hypothetical protein